MQKKEQYADQKGKRIVILKKEPISMITIIKKGTPKEEIKRRVNEVVSKTPKKDIMKFAGKLKTDIDPLEYQRQMRDEWE
ncbi:hypothetical protein [Nafulsella turpanensis]|uniref:hypothetical protein n=1 Tax=Nafulsella turpanensis TaxID=1265690 RepID=UPI00036801B1|nr:hypothetical protein [Nafulsella turpanensis]